jgi:diaminohydroxyphosphoribosylaminopyrimidine deaminase/5-amino-6-(5-phosphoribosylamino)uracil reductase
VLDSELRTPINAAVIRDVSARTTFLHRGSDAPELSDRRSALGSAGGRLVEIPADPSGRLSLPDALRQVAAAGSFDLLVEPGPTLAKSFFTAGLVDRVWVFASPKRIDDRTATAAAPVPQDYVATGTIRVGDDQLTEYLNPKSDAYFGPYASADIVLLAAGGRVSV